MEEDEFTKRRLKLACDPKTYEQVIEMSVASHQKCILILNQDLSILNFRLKILYSILLIQFLCFMIYVFIKL